MTGRNTGVQLGAPGRRARGRMIRLIRRYPFTFVGCVSYALLLGGVAMLDVVGEEAVPGLLVDAWRLLVLPAYLTTLAASRWGPELFGSLDATSDWLVPLRYGLRLAPFLLADLALALARRVAWR